MEKDLPSPRRWRMTEFHDHINAEMEMYDCEEKHLRLFPQPLTSRLEILYQQWIGIIKLKRMTPSVFQPYDTHQLAEEEQL